MNGGFQEFGMDVEHFQEEARSPGPREDLSGFGIYRLAICLGPTSRSLPDRVSLP